MNRSISLARYLPILKWGKRYDKTKLTDDSMASVIVAIMLIPQALALALIAGLPPQAGLYASIFGLSAYALFGTSNSLSVGPVAVLSLMTAAALAKLGLDDPGTACGRCSDPGLSIRCLSFDAGTVAAWLYGKLSFASCYQRLHNGERD